MAGQQRRSGDLDQQKAQRTGLRQRAVQEGERGRDCRKRKVISHHHRRTRRHHSPGITQSVARGYGSISTQKPRATHLFSSSLPRNKPAMTRQTSHAHATRCAHLLLEFGITITRVRDKISMQIVLTALIFQHKQVVSQAYCQKSNRP